MQKNRQQYPKCSFSEANCDGADAESLFLLFFSFYASFKNSSPREKVTKLSLSWDWWAKSLFVSIIVTKYNIFFRANKLAACRKKKFLVKQFAHAISMLYQDLEHAYRYWIWLHGSASYVIKKHWYDFVCFDQHMEIKQCLVSTWHSYY